MRDRRADIFDEALELLERGAITLENGQLRYGSEVWAGLRPALETARRLALAANPPAVSARPYSPPDIDSGWAALQNRLAGAPQLPALPPARPVSARTGWLERIRLRLAGNLGRRLAGAAMTLALAVALISGIGAALPGDPLYRAKLGWDYLGELTSPNADSRAQAALLYADNRLVELERLSAAGRWQQVEEAQGQFLRGLEAGLQQTARPDFTEVGLVYAHLNEQRERLARLVSAQYAYGPRSQYGPVLDRLNSGLNILAPRVPGTPPPGA